MRMTKNYKGEQDEEDFKNGCHLKINCFNFCGSHILGNTHEESSTESVLSNTPIEDGGSGHTGSWTL